MYFVRRPRRKRKSLDIAVPGDWDPPLPGASLPNLFFIKRRKSIETNKQMTPCHSACDKLNKMNNVTSPSGLNFVYFTDQVMA
jgi:hypothetical protein